MAKVVQAHADFASVQVIVNGVPLALHAEVDVLLKRPIKLDVASARAWNQITSESADCVTVELIPAVR